MMVQVELQENDAQEQGPNSQSLKVLRELASGMDDWRKKTRKGWWESG